MTYYRWMWLSSHCEGTNWLSQMDDITYGTAEELVGEVRYRIRQLFATELYCDPNDVVATFDVHEVDDDGTMTMHIDVDTPQGLYHHYVVARIDRCEGISPPDFLFSEDD